MKKNLLIVAVLTLIFSSCAVRKNDRTFTFQGKTLCPIEINGVPYDPSSTLEPITLNFTTTQVSDEVYKINGHAGCNYFFGQYEAANGKIKFSDCGMTRRMCDEVTNKLEQQISVILETANTYKLEKGKVILYNGKTPLAVFEVK